MNSGAGVVGERQEAELGDLPVEWRLTTVDQLI
jgi:hypothetical protein